MTIGINTANHKTGATTQPQHNGNQSNDAPKRILVADDEHLIAAGLTATLHELGYDVVGAASDGQGAIELCQRDQPDMALIDIRMPGMNGLDASKAIYERFNVPVIIVSAYSDREYVERCRDSGVFGYILKPFSKDQVHVTISIAWDRFRASADLSSRIDSLNLRLEQRKTIEKAKWAMVSMGNMSEPEAMRLLQRSSRDNRRPLIDVADDVLANNYLIPEEK